MTLKPLSDSDFSRLFDELKAETTDNESKLTKLYYSKGNFSGQQAATLLSTFKTAPEKIRALRILKRRLCRMSCSDGKDILDKIQLTQRDKLYALDCIKHTLYDHQTMEGTEYILSTFINEDDKLRALSQLTSISSYANGTVAAGGHFVSGGNGSIYSSGIPLSEHAYGPVKLQLRDKYGKVERLNFADTIKDKPNSMYTCHPSYSYGHNMDPSYYKHGGRPPLPPKPIDSAVTGPAHSLHTKYLPRHEVDGVVCHSRGDPCLGAEQSGVTPIGFIDHKKKEDTNCC
ncbi:unnamed protein product [Mesocestoides corti]|uniref:DUF4476 domain-containing protein n=1 Tax=Mesocestoides corti TaxID=53468 RepID=A0A0R3UP29_MESCO|nr:unnamed protein product [Mesocestoides corti]